MSDKVVDFESRKQTHEQRRKEAKVEALRNAFRLARGDAAKPSGGKSGRRKKSKK